MTIAALGPGTLHVVVDMQRLFAEATDWHVPTIPEVMEPILSVVRAHPRDTIFTRFMTPTTIEQASGDWQRFYGRWRSVGPLFI